MNRNLAFLVALVVGAWSSGSSAGEAENLARLAAMPREQRSNLSRNLDRFDALPPAERAAIRNLDDKVSRLDPAVQDRYRVVLRRYHVWVQGLPDDRKKLLDDAGSIEARLALANRWRKADREADLKARSRLVLGIHPADLGAVPPFEMANALNVWTKLDAAQKQQIESLSPVPRRFRELEKIAREKKIPMHRFEPTTEDELLDKLEADEKTKSVFGTHFRKVGKDGTRERLGIYNPLHQVSELLYFMDHPPQRVTPERLIQFEGQIPTWLRASLDPLPPEDARRRLTILYRQIYAPPAEIPAPARPAATKPKDAPKPAPPRADTPPVPF